MQKVKHLKNIIGPALAVDAVVFTTINAKLHVLLLKTKDPEAGKNWVLPGGFVKLDETLNKSAQRILREKSNISINYLEQLFTFGELNRDTRGRVVTTTYFALVDYMKFNLKTTKAYSKIEWFSVMKLPAIGYDHEKIIKKAILRIRNKIGYSNVVCHLLPREFSLSELQEIYEAALHRKLDKRNFRRKILNTGIIKAVGKKKKFVANRPAKLYKFISKKYQEVEFL